jgi:hypothetical protein
MYRQCIELVLKELGLIGGDAVNKSGYSLWHQLHNCARWIGQWHWPVEVQVDRPRFGDQLVGKNEGKSRGVRSADRGSCLHLLGGDPLSIESDSHDMVRDRLLSPDQIKINGVISAAHQF